MTHISAYGLFNSSTCTAVDHDIQPFAAFSLRRFAAYLLLVGIVKSIDYLKLVSTAAKKGRSVPLTDHDKALWGAIAYGAIATFVALVGVAVVASILGQRVAPTLIKLLLAGLFACVVYMSFFAWLVDEFPKATRILIGVPVILVVSVITKEVLFGDYEQWYMLVPIAVYLILMAALAFRQLSFLIEADHNDPKDGAHAA